VRAQGPTIDVPVAPGSPQAGSATVIPVLPGPGWGAPGVAPPGVARPPAALPPAPLILPPPAGPLLRGPYATPQRRSLADMANEQLRRDKRKDPLAEGMEEAGRDDCLHAPERPSAAGGLLAAPATVARALSGRCAR
jgi:hypothetical protein